MVELTPVSEVVGGRQIGLTGVLVSDGSGEEFSEAALTGLRGCEEQGCLASGNPGGNIGCDLDEGQFLCDVHAWSVAYLITA